jgi:hypothetical protein
MPIVLLLAFSAGSGSRRFTISVRMPKVTAPGHSQVSAGEIRSYVNANIGEISGAF